MVRHAVGKNIAPQTGAVNGGFVQGRVYTHANKAHLLVLQHRDSKGHWHAGINRSERRTGLAYLQAGVERCADANVFAQQ